MIVPTESALIEEVERIDIIIVCPNQWAGFVFLWDLYTIEVDRGNRNCYNYGYFGHLARNCKNSGIGGKIGESRRLEYRNGSNRQRRMIEWEN